MFQRNGLWRIEKLLEQYSNGYIISHRSEVENYTIRVRLLFIA